MLRAAPPATMTFDPRGYAVLYVDDEPENLLTFRYAFDDQLTILTAGSGPEALELLQRHDVAVLLSDQRMPGMSGIELCDIARRVRPDAVRMIVTAYADMHAAIDAINKGHVARYLLKPWRNDELYDVLRTALDFFHVQRTVRDMETRLLRAGSTQVVTAAKASLLHEVKNPLSALVVTLEQTGQVLGALQDALQAGRALDLRTALAELSEMHSDATLAAQQLRTVTERYSPQRPQLPSVNRCDCGRVADTTVRMLRRDVERVARLDVVLEDSVQVAMDASVLGQILLNLVINAAQAMEAEGTVDGAITVRVRREGSLAVISVHDTGPGIAPEVIGHVFQPHFTTRAEGTGLGLTIARELAEQHGGLLTARSEPGVETVVELRLSALE
jgi:signal transduction histidine kinase